MPEARAKAGEPRGTPVTVAGETWVLADRIPRLGAVWDRLFDQNVLARRYDEADLRSAAVRLLWAHYDLSPDEAVALAFAAGPADLVAAAEAALLGPDRSYRGYSEWVASALWSNGLDPARVPPGHLHAVLDQLVATGRAVPAHEFVSSAAAARERDGWMRLAGRLAK